MRSLYSPKAERSATIDISANTLFDDRRSIDGIALNPQIIIITVRNKLDANAYHGSDVTSRFDKVLPPTNVPVAQH